MQQLGEIVWDGRGELTEWPQRDWFVLLHTEFGYQPIWDRQPRTPSMLLADAARRISGAALDTEAWHDNALVRTTSAPRLMNEARLQQIRQRLALWSGITREPEPPKPVRARKVREHRVGTADELIREVQVFESQQPNEAVRACSLTNKIRHASKLWALVHRNRLASLPDERFPERLEVYKCRGGCGDWHVGHKA